MINPQTMNFTYWAHTLTQDFPNDTIPIVTDESNWRNFGNIVSNSPTFAMAGVPNTDLFGDWRTWAERVYGLLG